MLTKIRYKPHGCVITITCNSIQYYYMPDLPLAVCTGVLLVQTYVGILSIIILVEGLKYSIVNKSKGGIKFYTTL